MEFKHWHDPILMDDHYELIISLGDYARRAPYSELDYALRDEARKNPQKISAQLMAIEVLAERIEAGTKEGGQRGNCQTCSS